MSEHRDTEYPRDTEGPQNGGLQEKWRELCAVLNVDDPSEVVARVRDLSDTSGSSSSANTSSDRSSGDRLVAVSEVEQVIRDMHARIHKLRQRNEALVAQMGASSEADLQKAFRDLHNDSFQVFEALNVATADEAVGRIRSLKRQLDSLYRDKETLLNAGLGAPEDIIATVESLREAETSAEAVNDAHEALKQSHEELQQAHRTLEQSHEQLEQERQTLEDAHAHLEKERDQLEAELAAKASDAEKTEQELDATRTQFQAYKEDADRSKHAVAHMEAALEAARAETATTRDKLQAAESAKEAAENELRQSRTELQRSQTELNNARAELETTRAELSEVRTQLTDARSELADVRSERAEAQTQLHQMQDALSDANEQLNTLQSTVAERDNELSALQGDLKTLEDDKKALQSEALAQKHAAQKAHQEAEQARQSAAEAAEQVEQAQKALEAARAEHEAVAGEGRDIAAVLGVHTPEQARELEARVKALFDAFQTLREQQDDVLSEVGLESMDGVIDMIQSMEAQLADLYQQLEADSEFGEIQEILGISTAEEARNMASIVMSMRERLSTLAEEKQLIIDGVGVERADHVLALVQSMEEQLIDLYREVEAQNDAAADTSDVQAVMDILGVENVEDAQKLSEMVRSLAERTEALTKQINYFEQMGLHAQDAIAMITSMEEQLLDLYKDREQSLEANATLQDIEMVLGVSTLEQARELEARVKALFNAFQTLREQQDDVLSEVGLESMDGVIDMIQSMEAQLADLYQQVEANAELSEIQEILGVHSTQQARELSEIAHIMEEQLSSLYEEKEQLAELGVASIEDAVAMIQTMEQQLVDLYGDKEAELNVQALVEGQDTFDQLQMFYAEQERLERELGISSSESIIEMVQGLVAQLESVYQDLEASGERHTLTDGELVFVNGQHKSNEAPATGPSSSANLEKTRMMLASMEEQLVDLYADQEKLSASGISSIEDAMERIQNLTTRLDRLAADKDDYEQKLQRLTQILGVHTHDSLVERVHELKASASGGSYGDSAPHSAAPASSNVHPSGSFTALSANPDEILDPDAMGPETYLRIVGTLPFTPAETLQQIDTLSERALDQLPYGVMRLSDNGTIGFINEAGIAQLPNLKGASRPDVVRRHFFTDVAPSANNSIFHGRFREGVEEGEVDAVFPYTLVYPGRTPAVLVIHLYRTAEGSKNWVLFKPLHA